MRDDDLGWKPGADIIVMWKWYTAQGREHRALTSALITAVEGQLFHQRRVVGWTDSSCVIMISVGNLAQTPSSRGYGIPPKASSMLLPAL
jgi:predicted metal-dependent hydrolase